MSEIKSKENQDANKFRISFLTNLDFEKVWLGTIIFSVLFAIGAVITGDDVFINLEFIPVIFLLLQSGEDLDEKFVNSRKFSGVLVNFVSIIVVFYSVGFEGLAIKSDKPSKSLHRMLSANGNPTMKNFSGILTVLRQNLNVNITREDQED